MKNIVDYGANTANADNTANINNAIAACAVGEQLIIPEGTFKISGTVRVNKSLCIDQYGILRWWNGGAGIAAIVGNDDLSAMYGYPRWHGIRIERSVNWTEATIALQIRNVQYGLFDLSHLYGFQTGLELLGQGNGSIYNNIRLVRLFNNKTNIHVIHNAGGWVAETDLFGGHNTYSTGPGDLTGAKMVWFDPAGNPAHMSGIRFYGMACEAPDSRVVAAQIDGGHGFEWNGARFETIDKTKMPFNIASTVRQVYVRSTSNNNLAWNNLGTDCILWLNSDQYVGTLTSVPA